MRRHIGLSAAMAIAMATPQHAAAQSQRDADLAFAHEILGIYFGETPTPLKDVPGFTDGQTGTTKYQGSGCTATVVESYPASGGKAAYKREVPIDWTKLTQYSASPSKTDTWFHLDLSDLGRTESFYTGKRLYNPLSALNELAQNCSSFLTPEPAALAKAQTTIDRIVEAASYAIVEDGMDTGLRGTQRVIGYNCVTYIEQLDPARNGKSALPMTYYINWTTDTVTIDDRRPAFVDVDVGGTKASLFAGSVEKARELKAATEVLKACVIPNDLAPTNAAAAKPTPPAQAAKPAPPAPAARPAETKPSVPQSSRIAGNTLTIDLRGRTWRNGMATKCAFRLFDNGSRDDAYREIALTYSARKLGAALPLRTGKGVSSAELILTDADARFAMTKNMPTYVPDDAEFLVLGDFDTGTRSDLSAIVHGERSFTMDLVIAPSGERVRYLLPAFDDVADKQFHTCADASDRYSS